MRRWFPILLLLIVSIHSIGLKADEAYWEYTFRPGDSLWKIAEQYTLSANHWREIQRINSANLAPNHQIPPGTRLLIPVRLLKSPPTPATVIAVTGNVRLIRADGSELNVGRGELLYSGDRLVTSAYQTVRIQFADQSELQVLSDSDIKMDKLSHHRQTGMVDTRVRLNFGRVNTQVQKQKANSQYHIMTPAALTAVRGTAFRLSSGRDQVSRVEVTEGLVAVSAGGVEKPVEAGFGLIAEKDQPLKDPVKLLQQTSIGDNQDSNRYLLNTSWQPLQGALMYRYQVASDAAFSAILLDQTQQETHLQLADLQPGHYYLRVRGIDGNGLEGANSQREFEIVDKPERDDSMLDRVIPGTLLLIQ